MLLAAMVASHSTIAADMTSMSIYGTQMYAVVKYKITHKLAVMLCGYNLEIAATRSPVIMDEIVLRT